MIFVCILVVRVGGDIFAGGVCGCVMLGLFRRFILHTKQPSRRPVGCRRPAKMFEGEWQAVELPA